MKWAPLDSPSVPSAEGDAALAYDVPGSRPRPAPRRSPGWEGVVPDRPTGTVTFLFTDLEGQSALWEAHPEPMRAALARHDALLRAAVLAHGGHVVKATGDGLHAAFARAPDAVAAALDAQRALLSEAWG